MAKFKVVGPKKVVGVMPGDVVDDADLDGVDVAHLIAAGHLAPTGKAGKSAATKADEADETSPSTEEQTQ